MICLQCGKVSKKTEVYNGIPIGTCPDGHRTGQLPEGEFQERIEGDLDFLEKAS